MSDVNERERNAERSAPHRESTQERLAPGGSADYSDGKPPAGERIDGAEPIPHTPEQAARTAAGRRRAATGYDPGKPGVAAVALRRLVGFLLTTSRATVDYSGDLKAMVVVDHAGAGGATFDPGDILIDYDECEAIKDLLEQLVTDEAGRGEVGNVAFHPDDLRDALRRLDSIAELADKANGGPPTKKRFREALTSIRNMARGHTDPSRSEDNVRIENTALRAEIDRLRRCNENVREGRDRAEADTVAAKNQCDALDADLERMGAHLALAKVRNQALAQHAQTLVKHLSGEDAAWWAEAGEALVRLRELTTPDGAGEPQPSVVTGGLTAAGERQIEEAVRRAERATAGRAAGRVH